MQTELNNPSPAHLAKLERHGHRSVTVATLPVDGFMRIDHIIGNDEADPPIVGVFPTSKSSWWRGIREGRYPKGVKLGPNSTGWKVGDIRALLERTAQQAA